MEQKLSPFYGSIQTQTNQFNKVFLADVSPWVTTDPIATLDDYMLRFESGSAWRMKRQPQKK